MKKYIFENNTSITTILCKEIIDLFDREKYKNIGTTLGGINKKIKDTTDFNIPKDETSQWFKIEKFLYKELNKNLEEYIKTINSQNYQPDKNDDVDGTIFKNQTLMVYSFMIQKYERKKGKYTYHNDFAIDKSNRKFRVITFIWYLNTIEEGGETEFWDDHIIKPIAGKLVLFPASWTFQHRGRMPVSDDKYIITGWFYI
jgi:hypothetical protein